MTLAEFRATLTERAPPEGGPALSALWWAAKGHWDRAHEIVQDDAGRDAAWVMPICIAWKVISATPPIGTGRRGVQLPPTHSIPNGTASSQYYSRAKARAKAAASGAGHEARSAREDGDGAEVCTMKVQH